MRSAALRVCRLSIASAVVLLVISCGSGTVEYRDGVRPAPSAQDHAWLKELQPVLASPPGMTADQLMQTWKEFVGDSLVPLRSGNVYTFVFYDFRHSLTQVWLDASFAPGRLLPLRRWKETSLFWGSWEIPRPSREHYRYSDGQQILPDPFHAEQERDDGWHRLIDPPASESVLQHIVGDSEADLHGQDVEVLLPPGYSTDLSLTYPWMLVLGDSDPHWSRTWATLLETHRTRPVVVVSVIGDANGPKLRAVAEQVVAPWAKKRFRISIKPGDLTLVDWNHTGSGLGGAVWSPSSSDQSSKEKELSTWLIAQAPAP